MATAPEALDTMRRPVILILTALFALLAPLAAAAHAATASSSTASMEQDFVSRVNALRASKGLAPLVVDSELTSIARSWAAQMAQAGAISHNPNLANEVKADWTKLGENVGTGPDVPSIQQAFVNSPHHYENMVDPAFTRIGVGVVVAPNGAIYTSHEFERLASDDARPAAPAPAPAPVRVSRPAVTRPAAPARPAAPVAAPVAPAAAAPAPVVPDRIALSLEVSAGPGL
jgi:uncharacterized protein YkwD